MALLKFTGVDPNKRIIFVNPHNVLDVAATGSRTIIRMSGGNTGGATTAIVEEPAERVAKQIGAELDAPKRWRSTEG